MKMDIGTLPSGNYLLVVDVRDRERQLIGSRTIAFQRSNPLVDAEELEQALAAVDVNDEFVGKLTPEELRYSLKAILPLVPQQDAELVDIILRNDSLAAQRMYLYKFWLEKIASKPSQRMRNTWKW
ncbi:MAG: hypothetical protein R2795_01775 [Saprospiraceae bacterium]